MNEKRELSVKKVNSLPQTSSSDRQELPKENGEAINNSSKESKILEDSLGNLVIREAEAGKAGKARKAELKEQSEENKVQKVQYALSAVVCHIDDKNNEDRRNLVALIRVGERYHEKSNGNSITQWYIFNDFW